MTDAGAGGAEDAVAAAYARLRDDVLLGRLRPGEMLSQVRLAQRLGISRTPLREAMRRLVAEGLVAGDFNRRMRVSDLSLEDFDQIYAMRLALEPVAVRAAVPSLTETRRAAVASAVDAMDDALAADDMERFREHHRAFHVGVYAGAGERIERALRDLWDHSERYRRVYLHADLATGRGASPERLERSQSEHREILAAVLDRDAERAVGATTAHLRRTLDSVLDDSALVPRAHVVRSALGAVTAPG
jgi:DNA-binding GntR family transcriptional regulator